MITLSLQILQNCLMLINTLLVERTIEREGPWEKLTTEDLRALTPLPTGTSIRMGNLHSTSRALHSWRLRDQSLGVEHSPSARV